MSISAVFRVTFWIDILSAFNRMLTVICFVIVEIRTLFYIQQASFCIIIVFFFYLFFILLLYAFDYSFMILIRKL